LHIVLSALGSFVCFVAFSLATKLFSRDRAYAQLSKAHLFFLPLYFLLAKFSGNHFQSGSPSDSDILWGSVFYFTLQYPIFSMVYGILHRSFSLNICVALAKASKTAPATNSAGPASETSKPVTFNQLDSLYADGKGLNLLYQTRLESMIRNGLISKIDNDAEKAAIDGTFLKCTNKGRLFVQLRNLVLKIWNLKPIVGATK
jgi:hypothetical protein